MKRVTSAVNVLEQLVATLENRLADIALPHLHNQTSHMNDHTVILSSTAMQHSRQTSPAVSKPAVSSMPLERVAVVDSDFCAALLLLFFGLVSVLEVEPAGVPFVYQSNEKESRYVRKSCRYRCYEIPTPSTKQSPSSKTPNSSACLATEGAADEMVATDSTSCTSDS